ncbi:8-oxoguanine DNA glycosylase [Roseateles sp. 22389]|uniref:8-oxoguanine DNA glycosylase n=1 Tax=Roseateles sp. 22389 TaxID=3453916 RepID=UPI003F8581E6
MTQIVAIVSRHGSLHRELPDPDHLLLTGVRWGAVEEFPTPAYWTQQALRHRLDSPAPRASGRSLAEEVGAALLGGPGIPAAVGQAAFARVRERGAFVQPGVCEATLTAWLSEPLDVQGRALGFRFAAQKARHLAAVMPALLSAPDFEAGQEVRNWLMALPGVGPKTASAIVRGWSASEEVALLEAHLLRVGQVIGLFPRKLGIERHYLELEARLLKLCAAMDVRPSELEAVVAAEMSRSPETARFLVDHLKATEPAPARKASAARIPEQIALVFTA